MFLQEGLTSTMGDRKPKVVHVLESNPSPSFSVLLQLCGAISLLRLIDQMG